MNYLTRQRLLAGVLVVGISSAASAADKTPGLADVLKASGIDVSGYIDASYQHKSTDPTTLTYHQYDTEQKGFAFHALDVSISSLPASGFGGVVELTVGPDATLNVPIGETAGGNFDALQVFTQYSSGPFNIMAGKFTTLAGAEVAQAPSDTNFSRSFLFTYAEPLTHTGVRANYAVSDGLKFSLGVNNGWNILNENASGNCVGGSCATGKTLELGVAANPAKMLSVTGSYYSGDEVSTTTNKIGNRTLLDLVATVNISDPLSLVFNYDGGQQDDAVASGAAKWQGLASYLNYKINDTWRLSARVESFDDKQGFRTGTTQKLKESTLTAGYAVAKNAELRFEVRSDKSDQNVFSDGGTNNKKTQDSLGIEAVYTF